MGPQPLGGLRSPLATCAAGGFIPQTWVSSQRLYFWFSLSPLWSPCLPCVPSPGRVGGKPPGCPHRAPVARRQPLSRWCPFGSPHPALCCGFPGGLLHGHVPVRRARDPPRPRSHPAWSWCWDLVLHHAQVGEAHRRHGGLCFCLRHVCGGNGTGPGRCSAEGVRPPLTGRLTVPLTRPCWSRTARTQGVFNEKRAAGVLGFQE